MAILESSITDLMTGNRKVSLSLKEPLQSSVELAVWESVITKRPEKAENPRNHWEFSAPAGLDTISDFESGKGHRLVFAFVDDVLSESLKKLWVLTLIYRSKN